MLTLILFSCYEGEHNTYTPAWGGIHLGPGARKALAGDDSLTPSEKKMFIKSDGIPISKLERLSESDTPEIRHLVAVNPNVSENILYKLAKDEHVYVRGAVAGSPYSTEKLLLIMIQDTSGHVSRNALMNFNLSSDTIRLLFHIHDEAEILARNPSLPIDIMQRMLSSENDFVLAGLASNESLKESYIEELFKLNKRLINFALCRNSIVPSIFLEKYSSPELISIGVCARRLELKRP